MTVRWGILGCAGIADGAIAPAIRASRNGTLTAVASRDPAKAKAFAAKHGVPRVHDSYEALLADPRIDAVYLPLPVSAHATWAMRCAAAGKPTLVEKPFAATAAEGRMVAEAFAARGLPVGEALMYRFHPLTRRVVELIGDGVLGRPELFRATFAVDIPDRSDIRWRAETAGGALRDLGCYCVSLMRLASGEEPIAVTAAGRFTADGVDAALVGSLAFPGGALGHFGCSLSSRFECSYDLIGSAGRLRVDHGGMVAWPGAAFTIEVWRGDQVERVEIPPANHYQLMVEGFADAVLGVAPYGIPLPSTLANLEVVDRLLSAARASGARSLPARHG